ncbi:MAG TPA: TatD family hydrolase [Candidatus Saccharimonadales bacterium]|nr:TatD family hydrolase [Candidatus Saccharimonadales bacterium]
MNGLVDTHCHIHAAVKNRADNTARKWLDAGETDPDELIRSANEAGVDRLICVGTDLADSKDAVNFAQSRDNCFSSIGVHPHEAKQFLAEHKDLSEFVALAEKPKVVAVGEIGLDYYYEHSPRAEQIRLLEMFLQLAKDKNLPVIFHIREAFDDFWPILMNFDGIKGVLHSFTSTRADMEKALQKGLFIGLNGIMTFTRDEAQLEMAKKVPLDRLVLETDAPYLAPKPFRGKVCKPEYVKATAQFLAEIRNEKFENLAISTSQNASVLFTLK